MQIQVFGRHDKSFSVVGTLVHFLLTPGVISSYALISDISSVHDISHCAMIGSSQCRAC
jgi:hypothetical protein